MTFDKLDLAGVQISNSDFVSAQFQSSDWQNSHINNSHFYWTSFDDSEFQDTTFWSCEFRGNASNTIGPEEMAAEPFKKVDLSGAHFYKCAFFDSHLAVASVTRNRFDKCAFFYSSSADMPTSLLAKAEASSVKYALVSREGQWLNAFALERQRDDWRERVEQKDGIELLFKQLLTDQDAGDKSSEPTR